MEGRLQLAGWILFLVGVLIFLVAGLRNGDMWTIAGSILFAVGCGLFLIDLVPKNSGKG
jgi:hypothetical protein